MLVFFLLIFACVFSKSIECLNISSTGSCIECIDGWVLSDSLCFHGFCPSGYSLHSHCIPEANLTLFNYQFSKDSSFHFQFKAIQTEDRGLFFNKNSYLNLASAGILGPVFTLNFWLKLQGPGKILTYSGSDGKQFSLEFATEIAFFTSESGSLPLGPISDHWESLTFSSILTETSSILTYNQHSLTSFTILDYLPRSDSDPCWTLSGFTGFLYSITSINSIQVLFATYSLPDCSIDLCWSSGCFPCSTYAPRSLASCNYGYYWDSGLNACEICNAACLDCTGPGATACLHCSGSYALIEGICLLSCPLGFVNNGNICYSMSASTNGVVYDLDLTMITNNIADEAQISSSSIIAVAGDSSDFYPNYDPNDPFVVKNRGFYFDGSAYFSNQDYQVKYGPVFTIGTWLKPILGTGCITTKQTSSITYLQLAINNFAPSLSLYFTSLQSFTGSVTLTASSWNFLLVQLTLSNFQSIIALTVNTDVCTSSVLSTYYTDVFSDFYSTFGASYGSPYSNFYTGFMWSFTLYNSQASLSDFVQTSGCTSCSICPLNNSNNCLSPCSLLEYIDCSNTCQPCSSSCQTYGCVRDDIKCNLCSDIKCKNCNSFLPGCSLCVANAYIGADSVCLCNYNYVWSDTLEECVPCAAKCSVCDGGGYLGCSACVSGYYMLWGLCFSACPTGYIASSGNCVLSGGSNIMDLWLNAIEGVLYDIIAGIPVVAGSTASYYPYYDSDDPVASIDRGYYFNGADLMHFAPYLTYTTPYLVFAPVCYIGLWVYPTSATGIIYSNIDPSNSYAVVTQIELVNLLPKITLYLTSSTISTTPSSPSLTWENPVGLNQWNYIAFLVQMDDQERTNLLCYVNTVSSSAAIILGQGHFTHTSLGNTMLLGTAQLSATSISTDAYQGFMYRMIVGTDVTLANSPASTSCGGLCLACLADGTCLSTCAISEYPTGDSSAPCAACDSACTSEGCVDTSSTCNICQDPTCLICTNFTGSCVSYNCDSGYYKLEGMTDCELCDASCAECKGAGPTECTSCSTNYLLNGACYPFCPTGYTSGTNACTLSLSKIVDLDLSGILGVVPDSQMGFSSIAGSSNTEFYPSFDSNDPWPLKDRGYYFHTGSYLQFPPNSINSQLLTFGTQFTITAWISSVSPGVLFCKTNASYTPYLSLSLSATVTFALRFSSLITSTSLTSLSPNWNYIGVAVQFTSSDSTSLQFFVNTVSETPVTLSAGYYLDLQSGFYILIGAQPSATGYTSSWVGSLYSFVVYSQAVTPSDLSSACDSSTWACSVCPSAQVCLDTCTASTWWNGTACEQCDVCAYQSCVRLDAQCNLCQDFICLECDSFGSGCSLCKSNAALVAGLCQCDTHYVWDDVAEACDYCDPSSMATLQGACLAGCPTGYTNSAGVCQGTPGKILQMSFSEIIQGSVVDTVSGKITAISGNSISFYPDYDIEDPYAGKDRGYYFNGINSVMFFSTAATNDYQLVLSPAFSLGMWVNCAGPGVLFTKQSATSQSILLEITSSLFFSFSISINGVTSTLVSTSPLLLDSWTYLGVTVNVLSNSNTQAWLIANTQASAPSLLSSYPFQDLQSSFTASLGASYTSPQLLGNYFAGYLFSISVWNTDQSLTGEVSVTCTGGCSVCPSSGICTTACGLLQYYFSGACQGCSISCPFGCVRGNDCNLCSDRLCYQCKDYSATGCTACVDGASMVNGQCVCTSGTAQSRFNGNLYCDTVCVSACATCFSVRNGDCITCSEGYYFTQGLCLPNCQVGYSESQGLCANVQANQMVVHYVFDMIINDQPDRVNGRIAFMGSTSNYTYNYDPNDPIPVYQRGIYFQGSAKYAQLPPNIADNSAIILGNQHSIKMWLKPSNQNTGSCVLTKETKSNKYLHLTIDSSTNIPTISYLVTNTMTSSGFLVSATASALTLNSWQEVLITFQRILTSAVVTLYINGVSGAISGAVDTYFQDLASYTFTLGYSAYDLTSYQGFIYELRIYNYVITPAFPINCACGACTEDGDCLSACPFLTGAPDCFSCLAECTNGCTNALNCNLNQDLLCGTATGFLPPNCTECVPEAAPSPSGCQCTPNSIIGPTSCTCPSGTEAYANNCVPCYYSIQPSDITSYFAPDYLSLIFDMAYPLQATISSNCGILFQPSSLLALGTNPNCDWNHKYTSLLVRLGGDATILNQTVWFNANTLLTKIQTCGSYRGPISAVIAFIYEFPAIIPTALIIAPCDYYKYCGDLSISGSASFGGYGRPLLYMWNFTSAPDQQILDQYSYFSNRSELDFRNTSLSVGVSTVYLTVKNWLGYTATTYQELNILSGLGITLVVDAGIKWEMTTQMSKSIYVEATSGCGLSDSLEYTWSIDHYTGADARVNTSLLWSSQSVPSKLYIPKGSLGPGTYCFMLQVYDLLQKVSGRTLLCIVVSYSPLLVQFNPPSTTWSINEDLILDGSTAYSDPDQISANAVFNWTCANNTDCTSIITSPKSLKTAVLKENLSLGIIYNFTLFVSKGTRNNTGSLTVTVTSSPTISVTFSNIPQYINNQENFVIRSSIGTECNCTYYWTQISGPVFRITTLPDGKDLGILPFSLIPGQVYQVQVQINDTSGATATKSEYFTADTPPVDGIFLINPSTGTELVTVFELEASAWVDAKDPDLPLTYQFGYYLGGSQRFLNMRNESRRFYTDLLPAGNFEVFARIFDTFGTYSEARVNVTISTNPLQSTSLLADFGNLLQVNWTDPDTYPGFINFLALQMNTSAADDLLVFNYSLEALVKMKESLLTVDPGKIDVILQLLQASTPSGLNNTQVLPILDYLDNLTSVISGNHIAMSESRGKGFLDVVTAAVNMNYTLVVDNGNALSQANEVIKSLLQASALTMGQGQYLFFENTNIKCYCRLFAGYTVTSFGSDQVLNETFAALPTINQLNFNSSVSVLSVLSVYNDKQFNTTAEYSSALEFSLYLLQNNTVQSLAVNFADSGVNISIQVENLENIPNCGFWEGAEWSTAGCYLQSVRDSTALCTCNHMSLYTSSSLIGGVPFRNHFIVIYIASILGIIWIILSFYLVIKDTKEAESKIFIDNLLAEIPQGTKDKQRGFRPNPVADQLGKDREEDNRPRPRKETVYVPIDKIEVVGVIGSQEIKEGNAKEPERPVEAPKPRLSIRPLDFESPNPQEKKEIQEVSDISQHPVAHLEFNRGPSRMFTVEDSIKPGSRATGLGTSDSENSRESGVNRERITEPRHVPDSRVPKISSILPEVGRPSKKFLTGSKLPAFEEENPKDDPPDNAFFGLPQIKFSDKSKDSGDFKPSQKGEEFRDMQRLVEEKFSDRDVERNVFEKKQHPDEEEKVNPAEIAEGNQGGHGDNEYVYTEGTQLFTQTDTDRQHYRRTKKGQDIYQEVHIFEDTTRMKYPMWIADYYVSGVLFYHEIYSRFSRHSQGVASYLLQILLIGIILKGLGNAYIDDKGSSLEDQAGNIQFQDVGIALAVVLVTNIVVWSLEFSLFQKIRPVGGNAERLRIQRENRCKAKIGFLILLLVVVGGIVSIGFIEMTMDIQGSLLWVCLIFISFLFDCFFVQILKVIIYHRYVEGIALPS